VRFFRRGEDKILELYHWHHFLENAKETDEDVLYIIFNNIRK